ncbi:MAG: rhamnulokinase [Bacteroidales bacterium]|nr:rhamnulokinase [Bacteroidales bacterium]
MKIHLACDFGGGSGRVMAGWLEEGKVRLEEIHRFQNRQVRLGDTLYWDFPALFQDMKDGLRKAAERYGSSIVSIGIDTWGVDFGLIDRQGHLLGLPVCYRDARTKGLPERYFATRDRHEHYAHNGTQVMEINTLFQLLALKESSLPSEATLLFMPDLFSYYLTGVANNEYTIASTSELLNARTRGWDWELIDDAGLPRSLFGPIVMPGTVRGPILPHIAEETGLAPTVKVVAVASHDTASAVMSIPELDEPTAWISSGTWSLLGVTVNEPILTSEACDAGFTNEGGADGKITFLSNITGLWILQQLAKEWRTDDWAAMTADARKVQDSPLIDVDDSAFTAPESMQKAIFTAVGRELTRGETVRCVLESLAKRYATAIRKLNTMLDNPVRRLHIIGGGSQNTLLNELTAQATGLKVTTGDVEATAVGNVMGQLRAMGEGRL